MRRIILAGCALNLLLTGVGCRHWSRRPCNTCNDMPTRTIDGTRLQDPIPNTRRIPSTDLPTSPNDGPPPPSVPERRFRIDPYAPQHQQLIPESEAAPTTGRTPPKDILLAPDNALEQASGISPAPTQTPSSSGYLNEPLPRAGSQLPQRNATAPQSGSELPPRSSRAASPALPPPTNITNPPAAKQMPGTLKGLPDYTAVAGRDGVANGKLPTAEGVDTLKANGFRTVLVLHDPNQDIAATKELVEKRGLKFVAIPVSPENLKKALDDFSLTITDAATKPVYVADESGVRAGSLWYLFFRNSEMRSDDVARVRATPLGLPSTTTEEGKQFWLAIQQLLAKP